MAERKKRRKKFPKKAVITAVILVAAAGVAGGLYLRNGNSKKQEMPTMKSLQAMVSRGEISNTIVGTGNLESDTAVSLKIPSGITVEKVNVESGDTVKKGQTLATVSHLSVLTAMADTQESIDSLEEQIEDYEDGTDEDSTELEYEIMLAKKEALEATMEKLELLDEDGRIKAECAGTVQNVYVADGSDETNASAFSSSGSAMTATGMSYMAEGFAVEVSEENEETSKVDAVTAQELEQYITLSEEEESIEETKLQFSILPSGTSCAGTHELDINSVSEGQQAEITFDAIEDETFTGTVTNIDQEASASNGVAKYGVDITLEKEEQMKVGMNASATIVIEEKKDVLTIPVNALQERGNEVFVYTSQDEDGNLSGEKTVKTGLSDGENVEITEGLSEGEFVSIIGPSGSGKSTMMNIIGCLDTADEGEYILDGISIEQYSETELARIRNKKIGFIFQNFNLLPKLTAEENVELPLIYQGVKTSERKKRVREALEKVELSHRMQHCPTELSGGQQQRVAIARALVTAPSLFLADEPTGNLDSKTGVEIMKLFHELHEMGNTIVLTQLFEDDAIEAAAPFGNTSVTAKSGYTSESMRITGTTGSYFEIMDLELSYGRTIKQTDVENNSCVLVISSDTAIEFFGRADAVGESLSLNGRPFLVVGVLSEDNSSLTSGQSLMQSSSDDSETTTVTLEGYIPYSAFIRISDSELDITRFYASSADEESMDEAENAMEQIMLGRFGQDEDAFSIQNQSEIMEAMTSVNDTMSLMLGGIAAISLLVGGIGIMNIMLVSVTERTREIGIRKAIGASRGSIMMQFLMEALLVSMMGCVIGIAASFGILKIAGEVMGDSMSFQMDMQVMWISVGFSLLIGLIFGLYPANKAARKKPIDALRFSG